MRKIALLFCFALMTPPAMADVLTCTALRARIDAKLQEKGVPSYTLEIVPINDANGSGNAASAVAATSIRKGKEVGTCEGGTKRVLYTKGN